jgi:capsular polysaccharide transport system permease protein
MNAETADARPSRGAFRHKVMLAGFLAGVVLPGALGTAYMFLRAADQYQSSTAFSVKAEDLSGGLGALQAFTQITSSSVPDSAILFDFIQSRALVEKVDAELDLVAMFNRDPQDIVFSLGPDPSAEDLLDYWQRMVRVTLDTRTNILQLDVRAFTPEDAVAISEATIRNSTVLVNELSAIAQEDATRFANEDLEEAEAKLKALRLEIRRFRNENQMIDPTSDVNTQGGVLSALQTQLAESLVERAALVPSARPEDWRLGELNNRIEAIRSQIAAERAAIGQSAGNGAALTEIIGQYEELLVDLEFAQNAYTSAMAAVERAKAEARRQSRYLAVHIAPRPADESLYPKRLIYSGLIVLALLSAWSLAVLVYYNIRDRG